MKIQALRRRPCRRCPVPTLPRNHDRLASMARLRAALHDDSSKVGISVPMNRGDGPSWSVRLTRPCAVRIGHICRKFRRLDSSHLERTSVLFWAAARATRTRRANDGSRFGFCCSRSSPLRAFSSMRLIPLRSARASRHQKRVAPVTGCRRICDGWRETPHSAQRSVANEYFGFEEALRQLLQFMSDSRKIIRRYAPDLLYGVFRESTLSLRYKTQALIPHRAPRQAHGDVIASTFFGPFQKSSRGSSSPHVPCNVIVKHGGRRQGRHPICSF